MTTEDVQRDILSVPSWIKVANLKIEEYASFQGRFDAVLEALKRSKCMTKYILDTGFS